MLSGAKAYRTPKVQKRVNLVDLVKSFQTSYSNEYLLANFGVETAENEPFKVCQQLLEATSLTIT